MNKSESKYFNTACLMDEALIELLGKKDFEYITVKEICDKAGVNRSTFYLHYENMTDLLEESVAFIHNRFMNYMSEIDEGKTDIALKDLKAADKENLYFFTDKYLYPYLDYVKENKRTYVVAIKHVTLFQSVDRYQELFGRVFSPVMEKFGIPVEKRNYMMMFYLNGIQAVVNEWIRTDCITPIDEVIKIIQTCINFDPANKI